MEEYIKMLEKCNLLLTDNMTGLSSWITILTVLITVIAAILPFIVTDRQHKFEKETENKFKDFEKEIDKKISDIESKYKQQNEKIEKNQETTRDLYMGVSRVFRNISEQYFKNYENLREGNYTNVDYVSLIADFFITMINELICIAESTNIHEYKMFYDYYSEKIKYIKEKNSENLDEVVKKITEQFYSEDLFVSRQKLQNTFGKNNKIINNIIKMLSFIYNSYKD